MNVQEASMMVGNLGSLTAVLRDTGSPGLQANALGNVIGAYPNKIQGPGDSLIYVMEDAGAFLFYCRGITRYCGRDQMPDAEFDDEGVVCTPGFGFPGDERDGRIVVVNTMDVHRYLYSSMTPSFLAGKDVTSMLVQYASR
jgi:hypothetical protein